MSIPVIYYDNTEDSVPDITLEQLLSAHRIKMFYRFSEGWVTVEAGILRGKGGTYAGTYSGPERRSFTSHEETGGEPRQLWDNRELIKRIYEESPVGIGICDSFGKLLDANRACLEIFGLRTIAEAGAFNLFVEPDIPDEAKDRLRNAETVQYQMAVDFDQDRASGLYNTEKSGVMCLDMLVSPVIIPSSGMCLYIVQMQDITRQKAAGEQLLAITHGKAIGERARGIAHDLNNLLQVILGNIYLAEQLETPERKSTTFLERAGTAALSACELGGRLTAIADASPLDREVSFGESFGRKKETGHDADTYETSEGVRGEAGRVLVMDDTEAIRRIAGAFLMRAGYDLEFAVDGDEAVRIYENADRRGQPFDAVLLDLTVPGGSGAREAMVRLLGIDPDIRAIVSSGYHDDPVMTGFGTYGFKAAVAKPYTMQELARAVDAVIHGD